MQRFDALRRGAAVGGTEQATPVAASATAGPKHAIGARRTARAAAAAARGSGGGGALGEWGGLGAARRRTRRILVGRAAAEEREAKQHREQRVRVARHAADGVLLRLREEMERLGCMRRDAAVQEPGRRVPCRVFAAGPAPQIPRPPLGLVAAGRGEHVARNRDELGRAVPKVGPLRTSGAFVWLRDVGS